MGPTILIPDISAVTKIKADHETLKARPRLHSPYGRRPRYPRGTTTETTDDGDFGRITEVVTRALDWDFDHWGKGKWEPVDTDGNSGDEEDVYNRYFDGIPVDTPVWTVVQDGVRVIKNAGCNPGPVKEDDD